MSENQKMKAFAKLLLAFTGVALSVGLFVGNALARPTYFDTFRALYGINDGDNLDACGVCHFLWTGTGARNPFGNAVEQQLYVGKSITQALTDIETVDSDSDGFTNIDEILAQTLPGYSCSNFQSAVGQPPDWHTYITPGVPSCLEPMDIRVSPATISVLTEVGDTDTAIVEIFNNGTDFAIEVSNYEFLAGTSTAYTANGPSLPISIPVGASVTIDVVHTPLVPALASGTFRITSDDPDEPTIDIPLSGFAFVKTLAPADARAACRSSMDKQFRKYTKTLLREWSRCYQDEVYGIACDTGARDLKIGAATDRLKGAIGGAKDRQCAGAGLSAPLLDLPLTCGGGCGDITITTIANFADCLVCRGDEAVEGLLDNALGTAPPDLPSNVLGDPIVQSCQKRLLSTAQKGVFSTQKILAPCETTNITSVSPVDCAATLASELGVVTTKVNDAITKCDDSTGMLGCLFDPMPDPTCLGTAAESIGSELVEQVFEVRD